MSVKRHPDIPVRRRPRSYAARSLGMQVQRTLEHEPSALLDALYGAAPVGLGFWDRELRYVRVNEALARINELPAAEHVGKTMEEVIPQLAHVLRPIAQKVLDTGQAVTALEIAAGSPGNPDERRDWLASYYPVLTADGEVLGVGAVVEDITERRRAARLTELQSTVSRILANADSVEAAVPAALEALGEIVAYDVVSYWPADPDLPRVTWVRPGVQADGFVAMTARMTLSPQTLPGRVEAAGEPVWLEGLEGEGLARASVADAEGLRSAVAFPLLVEGEFVGAIEAFTADLRRREPELLASLAALGLQLGQFVRRKRAEEERGELLRRERAARADAEEAAATLGKLERVSEAALAHQSLGDLLRVLLERIVEVLEADSAAILLVGDDGMLHLRATVGFGETVEHAVAVPFGAGLAGTVAATRAPLLVPDLSAIELASPVLRLRGINSAVAIPLVVEDRVIGVVHADSVAFAQFREQDARLLELIADRIALAISQAALADAERAAQERLHFLAEASTLLAATLDVDETLAQVARLAVPHFADWCAVDLVTPAGAIDRVAVAHVDPERVELARRLTAAFPPSLDDEHGVGAVISRGEAVLSAEIDEDALRAAFGARPAYLDALLRLGLTSTIVVPLQARGRTLGALTFVSAESRRVFDDADLRFAQELAARAAVAVDNAHLYGEAERGRERLAFLAEASALLGSSLDVDRTLEQLGSLLAGRAADWCAIHLLDESGTLRFVTVSHRDPLRTAEVRDELAAAPRTELPDVVRRVLASGEPELFTEPAGEPPEGSFERREGVHTGLVVPLVARHRPVGTLSLVRAETPEAYTPADLEFAADVARRAAVAIDNAQLYRAAEERAQAARVLASVGDGVFLVDRRGIVRTWNRAASVATGLRAGDVVDRPADEAIPGWSAISGSVPVTPAGAAAPRAESLPLELAAGRESWLSIHGVAVPDGVVYAFRDLTEERALEQMRTEFVSTVSHELRTPLAAIYGAAMTLCRSDVALDEDQRSALLDVVSGEADRLARTVNDILWASRLDTDSLHVTISSCDAAALARDVVDAQLAHLDEAHELVLEVEPGLPAVAGDPEKVGRVLINLVDNAVKYSPDGGRVTVTVRPAGSHVRFEVSDQGLGIPPAEQRRIFEKFYRLDPNMTRGVGGTGLGLYICRELVRRMDGRLWVASDGLGRGSTFHVELPAAPEP